MDELNSVIRDTILREAGGVPVSVGPTSTRTGGVWNWLLGGAGRTARGAGRGIGRYAGPVASAGGAGIAKGFSAVVGFAGVAVFAAKFGLDKLSEEMQRTSIERFRRRMSRAFEREIIPLVEKRVRSHRGTEEYYDLKVKLLKELLEISKKEYNEKVDVVTSSGTEFNVNDVELTRVVQEEREQLVKFYIAETRKEKALFIFEKKAKSLRRQ